MKNKLLALSRVWKSPENQNQTIKFWWVFSGIILLLVLLYHVIYHLGLETTIQDWRSLKLLKDASSIIAGVACSVIAATSYDLTLRIRAEAHQLKIRKEFVQLFGHHDIESQPNVESTTLIILPGYKQSQTVALPSANLPEGEYVQAHCQEMPYNAKRYSAITDTTAATRIIALYQELGLPLPKIRACDADDLEALLDTNSQIRCIISIGLYSNSFLMNKALRAQTNPLVEVLVKREREKISHKLKLRRVKPGLPDNDFRELTEEGRFPEEEPEFELDHALIAKFKYSEKKTLIVLGGMHELGTVAISRWLKRDQNWRTIANWGDLNRTNLHIGQHNFAAILTVKRFGAPESSREKPEVIVDSRMVRIDILDPANESGGTGSS